MNVKINIHLDNLNFFGACEFKLFVTVYYSPNFDVLLLPTWGRNLTHRFLLLVSHETHHAEDDETSEHARSRVYTADNQCVPATRHDLRMEKT